VLKRKKSSLRSNGRAASWATPAIFALAGVIFLPSVPAEADVASLLSAGNARDGWRNYMVSAAAGSIHEGELVFKDADEHPAAPKSRGIVFPNGKRVALTPDVKPVPDTPDEDRITRPHMPIPIRTTQNNRPSTPS